MTRAEQTAALNAKVGTSVRIADPASRRKRLFVAFCFTFVVITLVRFEVIASPPYWDFAIGLWPEADYLAESGFDYHGLRYEETHSLDYHGGRRSYMTSILPGFLALLMRTLSSPTTVIVTYHLFIFASAAASAVMLFSAIAPQFGPLLATLTCLVVFTNPLFSTQIDMVGMEIPMASFAIWSAMLVEQQRYVSASLVSGAAYLMKATGLVVTLSILLLLVVLLLTVRREPQPHPWRRYLAGLAACLVVLGLEIAVILWGTTYSAMLRSRNPNLIWTTLWCPDLLIVFLICMFLGLLVVCGSLFRRLSARRRRRDVPNAKSATSHPTSVYRMLIFCAFVVLGTLAATTRVPFLPRYLTLAVPFLIVAFVQLLLLRRWRRSTCAVLLAGLAVLNLFNWNGALFPDQWKWMARVFGIGVSVRREGSFLERSHEYLENHRIITNAVKTLELAAGDDPIVVGHPLTYCVSLPSLGYVSRPLRGYAINGFTDAAANLKDVSSLLVDVPPVVVFSQMDTTMYILSRFDVPEPEPGDEIIYYEGEASPLILFRRRLVDRFPEKSERREWYVDRLWPGATFAKRLWHLISQDELDTAIDEALLLAESPTRDEHFNWIVVGLLYEAGRDEEAMAHQPAWPDDEPNEIIAQEELPHLYFRGKLTDGHSVMIMNELAEIAAQPNGLRQAALRSLQYGWDFAAGMYFRALVKQQALDSDEELGSD